MPSKAVDRLAASGRRRPRGVVSMPRAEGAGHARPVGCTGGGRPLRRWRCGCRTAARPCTGLARHRVSSGQKLNTEGGWNMCWRSVSPPPAERVPSLLPLARSTAISAGSRSLPRRSQCSRSGRYRAGSPPPWRPVAALAGAEAAALGAVAATVRRQARAARRPGWGCSSPGAGSAASPMKGRCSGAASRVEHRLSALAGRAASRLAHAEHGGRSASVGSPPPPCRRP